jgi:hypothetical protein
LAGLRVSKSVKTSRVSQVHSFCSPQFFLEAKWFVLNRGKGWEVAEGSLESAAGIREHTPVCRYESTSRSVKLRIENIQGWSGIDEIIAKSLKRIGVRDHLLSPTMT